MPRQLAVSVLFCLSLSHSTAAQPASPAEHMHDEMSAPAPTSRDSTGTSWVPDTTPMNGIAATAGPWALMLHGEAFGQFLAESGNPHHRSSGTGSINWLMLHAGRSLGSGRLSLRTMVSAEPWTIRGCGYPDLLATGEVCDGDTIHDRQHPHDLFMEVTARYDRPLTRAGVASGSSRTDPGIRFAIYGGPAGEPALGPPAFLHRPSAEGNPIAPIAHHWLDATHISFGVVTGAVYSRRWQMDASVFNGREPDDRRRGFDLAPLDSYAARISMNPAPSVALQVSAGHMHDREAGLGTQPRQDVNLATASAIIIRSAGARTWATTFAYGVKWGPTNIITGFLEQTSHAALAESSISPSAALSVFGRFELVGKPAHDFHADEFIPAVFTVAKLQAGAVRYIANGHGLRAGIGGTASLSMLPSLLAPRYEGRLAPGGGVFVTISPGAGHTMAGMQHAVD